MQADPKIILSFDVEEFDLPCEYGNSVSFEDQISFSREGMKKISSLLDKYAISSTLFTTATFAIENKRMVKELAAKHEIASHGLYHSSFEEAHLLQSKKYLEEISETKVKGFRMPRMQKVSPEKLVDAGYTYNASLNPTWLPGRYNNLHLPRKPFMENHLVVLPSSVTRLRFPLFWLTFKNLRYSLFKKFMLSVLKQEGYLHLYFHPWEFMPLQQFNIPSYIKKTDGDLLLKRLDTMLADLQGKGKFVTASEFIDTDFLK